MTIHTVKKGESIYSIARDYGISEARIVEDNAIDPKIPLFSGQTLLVDKAARTCTVRGGDTLAGIAEQNGVSEMTLLQNNPILWERGICPSQTLHLEFDACKENSIFVAAYTESADPKSFEQCLPNLSAIILRGGTEETHGAIRCKQDVSALIAAAEKYRVLPFLSLPMPEESNFLRMDAKMENLLTLATENGFRGIEIEFLPCETVQYHQMAETFSEFCLLAKERGLQTMAALYPVAPFNEIGERIMDAADWVALQSFIWDSASDQTPAASAERLIRVIDHNIIKKFHKKVLLGIPTFGVDYAMRGKLYQKEMVDVATCTSILGKRRLQADFDEKSMTPTFSYTETPHPNSPLHIIHYEDARSYLHKLCLVESYRLGGVCVYSLQNHAPQFWQILSRKFTVNKF